MIKTTALLLARSFSYVLYIVLRYLVRYRYPVIRNNFSKAFPNKGEKELRLFIRSYYRHVSDLCVEPFLFYLAPTFLRNRLMTFDASGVLDKLYAQNKNVVMLASHYGNWEYLVDLPQRTGYHISSGYSPASNRQVDQFLYSIRSKFGVNLVPKQTFYRQALHLLKKEDKPHLVVVIGDQRPAEQSRKHTVSFLGIDTDVQIGGERMAIQTDAAVVLIESVKTERFCYRYTLSLIEETAAKTQHLAITTRYFAHLERAIRASPAEWLWSHNRWKDQSSVYTQATPPLIICEKNRISGVKLVTS